MPSDTTTALAPLAVGAVEAARLLGIGRRLLWSKTAAKEIPSVRIGRRVVYRVIDLERWLEEQAK